MLEKKYFSLPELVERWGINIHDLLYLAENKLFNLKVRAFNVCGTWCQNQTNAGISYELPLKSGEMSGLFPISLKSARQIMINQAVELTKLLADQDEYDYIRLGETLKLSMEDLVMLSSDKQKLEKTYGFQDQTNRVKTVNPSANIDDFYIEELPNGHTKFSYHDKEYIYGKVQSAIVKQLYEAAKDGRIWMYGKTLLKNAGSSSFRLGDIFKPHRDWMEIIKSNNQGLYRLYLD